MVQLFLIQAYIKRAESSVVVISKIGKPVIALGDFSCYNIIGTSCCHRQFMGISKPKREMFIDEIIPAGI